MCFIDMQRSMRVERLGRVPYGPMLALQEQRHAEVLAGTSEDTLFLLEHEPVVTLGRNSGTDHVLVSPDTLAARGVELFHTGRGGDVTYHGPGQIVGYPIMRLEEGEQDVRRYVASLEEVMLRTARDFGVRAERVPGLRGVWVGKDKLGAVGVRIANWTTLHGFALNAATDLDAFKLIVPCGIADRGVTSLARLCGTAPVLADVEDRLAYHAAGVLDREVHAAPPTPLSQVAAA